MTPLITVPSLVGLELATAEQQAKDLNLRLQVTGEEYAREIPAMHIHSQTPAAGTRAPADSEIRVVVSLGPQPITMPDVVGFPASVKQLELQELGLRVTLTEAPSREPAGLILAQMPSVGTEVTAGTSVTLTVSDGSATAVRANLDNKLLLVACEIDNTTFRPGDTAKLVVIWQVLNPLPDEYKTFIHITDAGGRIVTQFDGPPLQGRRPTNTWRIGEEIVDPYNILLPESIPLGMYTVRVGMYRGGQRLPVLDPGTAHARDDAVIVHQLTIVGD
jgi:hypothetical protein